MLITHGRLKILLTLFFTSFLVLGMLNPTQDSLLAGYLFDVALISIFTLWILLNGARVSFYMLVFLLIFVWTIVTKVIFSELPAVATGFGLRPYIYAIFLSVIQLRINRHYYPITEAIKYVWRFFLLFAIVKYTYVLVTIGHSERTGLLIENNFELLVFFSLFSAEYFAYFRQRSYSNWILGWMALIVLSQSRSGALMICLFFLAQWAVRLGQESGFKSVLKMVGVTSALGFALGVSYLMRPIDNLGDIDRFQYLLTWIGLVSTFDVQEIVFGRQFTWLGSDVCGEFSIIGALYSDSNQCVSAVFTAGLLRHSIDFGIFGVLVIYLWAYIWLRRHCSPVVSLYFLGLLLLNATSVSSLSSSYGFFALLGGIFFVKTGPLEVLHER